MTNLELIQSISWIFCAKVPGPKQYTIMDVPAMADRRTVEATSIKSFLSTIQGAKTQAMPQPDALTTHRLDEQFHVQPLHECSSSSSATSDSTPRRSLLQLVHQLHHRKGILQQVVVTPCNPRHHSNSHSSLLQLSKLLLAAEALRK